jgi:hypothetical protein
MKSLFDTAEKMEDLIKNKQSLTLGPEVEKLKKYW